MLIKLEYFRLVPSSPLRRIWLRGLWIANVSLGLLFLLSQFFIDLNDCYFGMSAAESKVARIIWSLSGIVVSVVTFGICVGKSSKMIAFTTLISYGLLGLLFIKM